MERIFKNTFFKGISKDLDYAITPGDKFVDAHNVFLTGDDKFLALENLKGTTEIDTITASFTGDSYVLGVYANKYSIDAVVDTECLTIITAKPSGKFKIWCYDLDNSDLYELFEQDFTADFEASNPVIDAVVYPENGIDVLYFTDNYNEIRKLRCEITTPFVANSIAAQQLSLQRRATLAKLTLNDILTTGGSLLCGSYQFCLRFFNETTRTYTKWTIPTHPINISRVVDSGALGEGGYGMTSTKQIEMLFSTPTEEVDYWTHFQYAVIENTSTANPINASLLKLETLTGGSIVGDYMEFSFIYDSNKRIDFVPIEDIVVDLAAIDKVKTLQVKNNRLIAGNVTYNSLDYDREPIITAGEVVTVNVDNKDDYETSTSKGYFRDEVYRFYASYFDEKYNFSRPFTLDLTDVTGNQTTAPTPIVNLFSNGTFTGSLAGWSQTGATTAWVYGTNSAVVSPPGMGVSSQVLYQSLVLSAGTDYTLNYQVVAKTGSITVFNLVWLNGTSTLSEQSLLSGVGTYTTTVVPPATADGVGFRFQSTSGAASIEIDNLEIGIRLPDTVWGFDLKLPSRKIGDYTLLDTSNNVRYLNLDLTLTNHPSWARGFVILRAERKKKIKFQTPFIPSSLIEGIEVIGDYPTSSYDLDAAGTGVISVDYTDATPMSPLGTLMPKNLFRGVRRDFIRVKNDDVANKVQKGETYVPAPLTATASNSVFFVYPPNIYGTGEDINYTFSQGDSYEVVDYAFTKSSITSHETNTTESKVGNFVNTSVHGTFYAGTYGDYYYNPSADRSDPSLPNKEGSITEFKEIDAFGEGTIIAGVPVGQYNQLETGNVFYNQKPNNQRCAVVKLSSDKVDSMVYGNSTYAGNTLTTCTGAGILSSIYEVNQADQTNTFVNSKASYTNKSSLVNIVDIVNIVNQYGDDRYGDTADIYDLIFTGAMHVFSADEVTQIGVDGAVPVSLRVAGGDCYVTFQQFKITDNHYGLTDIERTGSGSPLNTVQTAQRWDKVFKNKFSSGLLGIISMPVPYKNVSQVVSVYIESEVLGDVTDVRPYDETFTDGNSIVIDQTDSEYVLRVPFSYTYNKNYSNASNQKAFIPYDPNELVTTKYKARLLYSNQKVFNTDIQGFDQFGVSSFFDLEETYGGITKLALAGDDMVAIQESATAYVPVDSDIIQTASGGAMSVRSGEVIGQPIYLSRIYGSQHLKGVRVSDDAIFFPDNDNQAVIKVRGQQLELIHENGMITEFNDQFGTDIAENQLFGLYDNNRRHYWTSKRNGDFCWIWDDRLQCWVANYDFTSQACFYDGIYAYNKLYLLGRDASNNLKVYTMYTGNHNTLLGETVTPSVSFSINPEIEQTKTFDNITIYSTNKLGTMDILAEKQLGSSAQEALAMDIDIDRREGTYRIAVLRDTNSARLRSTRATAILRWRTDNEKASLSGVVTKYRASNRPV